MFEFEIRNQDSKSSARTGILHTDHGPIKTPIFMPVGTAATVKGVHFNELDEKIKAQIILSNTYHLFLRPGTDVIKEAGGLHEFMSWDKPILTDSGGFQVYSLSQIRKLTEEGVEFRSHIDGSKQFLSPEKAIDVQRELGADIIMAFDECTPYPCEYNYAKRSMKLTHRWLDRCLNHFDQNSTALYGYEQTLAPIVQGSIYEDLRIESAEYVTDKNCPINAIGGLSVGEPEEELYRLTEVVTNILPKAKPRYLMGVGKPENILNAIALGIDMFDCVLPSRNARHGIIYTTEGVINIKNRKWQKDFSPIDPNIDLDTSLHTKAYLRHLLMSKELLAAQIATIQNLRFYLWLIEQAQEQIDKGTFGSWKDQILPIITQRL